MKCAEYHEQAGRCQKGMGVTQMFKRYFCETRPERCPVYKFRKESQRHAATA